MKFIVSLHLSLSAVLFLSYYFFFAKTADYLRSYWGPILLLPAFYFLVFAFALLLSHRKAGVLNFLAILNLIAPVSFLFYLSISGPGGEAGRGLDSGLPVRLFAFATGMIPVWLVVLLTHLFLKKESEIVKSQQKVS